MNHTQNTRTRRALLLAVLVTGSAHLALSKPARALVVYDPANHAENLIQTAQALYAEIQRDIANRAVSYTAFTNELNLLPLDPMAQAALQPNLSTLDDAVIGLRQVQQTASGMTRLFDQLRNQSAAVQNGGDIAAMLRTIDTIGSTLNRDVANISSAMTSMTAADAQLSAILTRSAMSVGAMQAQQINHHLQAMQVRESMHRRQLQAIAMQRAAVNEELEKARAAATREEARRQFHALATMGKRVN